MIGLIRISLGHVLALANAFVFLLASLAVHLSGAASAAVVLVPNLIFLIGSVLTFLALAKRGQTLLPITWYVLGGGIFFGFGVIAGGLNASEWSARLYGGSTGHLVQANLLNSTSVAVVLVVALLVLGLGRRENDTVSPAETKSEQHEMLTKIFPYLLLGSSIVVLVKFVFFPIVHGLLLRSFLDKAYFFLPSCFLLFGFLLKSLPPRIIFLSGLLMACEVFNGLISFNKSQMLMPMAAYFVGLWTCGRNYRFILSNLIFFVVVFWLINPMVSVGRHHKKYHPIENSLTERIGILQDYVMRKAARTEGSIVQPAAEKPEIDLSGHLTNLDRAKAVGARFDVASIQGYLIKEYDAGRPGNSLSNAWAVLVPRFIWPDKPVITRVGNELNAKYFNDPGQISSSIAPTYSAEAYWNYGTSGAVVVSIYLGVCFGFLSRLAVRAQAGRDPAYLFVAFPALFSAAFVESWIVSTYIGGMAVIVLSYFVASFSITLARRFFSIRARSPASA